MDHQVIQINENSWRVEDGGVRFFLLTGSEKALLVDSGMTVPSALSIVRELTDKPIELINTHADRDHVGSNRDFDSFRMSPADESAYRAQGGAGELIPVADGDRLDLGDRPLEIIALPGHTPGSIGILDIQGRFLISGDPIQSGNNIFMFGPARNMGDYIASLTRLSAMTDRFDALWPSHGDFPISPERISRLRDGAQAVLNGEVRGEPMDFHGRSIVRYPVDGAAFLCDK